MVTKLDPDPCSAGEEPFLQTPAVGASGKAWLGAGMCWLSRSGVSVCRVGQKNPRGDLWPVLCILQARYKNRMCALSSLHVAILLRNGAMLSSSPWTIPMARSTLTPTVLSTGWKALLSGWMRNQRSQYPGPTQPAVGQLQVQPHVDLSLLGQDLISAYISLQAA